MVNRIIPWMDSLLASPAQVRFLRLLARDPAKYWTGREVARELGMPQSTANVVLRRLRRLNVLDIRQVGPSHLFRLRTDLAIIDHLLGFFTIEEKTMDDLAKALNKVVPKEASCTLFGSSTRGERKNLSDVDILVVSSRKTEAKRVADEVRAVLRSRIPFSTDVLPLSRQEAKGKEYRPLVQKVLVEGRHLAGTSFRKILK